MFARKLAGAIAVCAMLAAGSVGYAGFSTTLVMESNLPGNLATPGQAVEVYVYLTAWSLNAAGPGNDVTGIQLGWTGSDAALNLNTAAWAFDAGLFIAANNVDDDMSDSPLTVLFQTDMDGAVPGAVPILVGTLSFNAPVADGDYVLDLSVGTDLDDSTWLVDADTTGDPEYVIDQGLWGNGNALKLSPLTITVPEPATIALLAAGGVLTLVRRRRTR